ncbi:MAG: hypothetical protein JSU72_04300 [Deltaproteobacteria bacterium]|nr:MAG: hypothetical protein JSU72_04300 [Deltaproteobacteria bacterium]
MVVDVLHTLDFAQVADVVETDPREGGAAFDVDLPVGRGLIGIAADFTP